MGIFFRLLALLYLSPLLLWVCMAITYLCQILLNGLLNIFWPVN